MDYARLRLKRRLIFSLLVLCLAVAVFIVRSGTSSHQPHATVSKVRSVQRPPDAGPTPGDSHDPCDPSSARYDQSACSPGTYGGGSPSHSASSHADATPPSDSGSSSDSGDPCDPSSAVYDPSLCDYASANVASVPDPTSSPDPGAAPSTSPTTSPSGDGGATSSGGSCNPSSGDPASCDGGAAGSDSSQCDSNYEGACVPIRQGDAVNCKDVDGKNFRSVGSDPYRLDADHDGIACES